MLASFLTTIFFSLSVIFAARSARVLGGPSGLVVHADMPALRTRTDFDLPLGRLVLRLGTAPTEGES